MVVRLTTFEVTTVKIRLKKDQEREITDSGELYEDHV